MLPHISPRAPGFEVSQDSVDVSSLPPPPPRTASNGPDTRRHGHRPPALNTALTYVPGQQHLTTPSSLSSPFTLSNPNTGNAITTGSGTGATSRGVSPAHHRLSSNFGNMAYNPQEWAGGRQSVEARNRRDCYGEPLQTPPPPYPAAQDQRSSFNSIGRQVASYGTPDVSRTTTPVAQEPSQPSDTAFRQRPTVITSSARQSYDPRRSTQSNNPVLQEYNPASQQYRPHSTQAGTSTSTLSYQVNNRASHDGAALPPPPPRRQTPSLNGPVDQGESSQRLDYTRRSTSAGPTPTAGPSMTRVTRTLSGEARQESTQWHGTTNLPGPPSIPPPSKSRSASAHADPNASFDSTNNRRPPRLNIRNSNLTPIPATPNSIVSGASARPQPFPLRIDTALNTGHGKAPVPVSQPSQGDSDSNRNSQAGPSSLARRSAVRGPAARSSMPLRSRSKSQSGRSDIMEPPSTTLSNNPWASALEQTRSPQDETLPESALLPIVGNSLTTNGTAPGRSHTPPATPSAFPQKQPTDTPATQPKVLPTPPLSQKPLLSANSMTTSGQLEYAFEDVQANFMTQAMERHQEFLRQEENAACDAERLSLFVQFMHQESLIRRERYITAFRSDDFDVEAAKNMLFNGAKIRRASTRDTATQLQESSSAQATANPAQKADSGWWKDYKPQLSPIASMDYDEMSSRGRAPSRWWESQTGSQTDGQGPDSFRSKRESKYMSLSKKLLQDMETGDMDPLPEHAAWASQQVYPDEKANPETFGFYDDGLTSPPLGSASLQRTPRSSQLDISRFVTLPPPYPRHHPAVNNSHPDLAEYRTTVRMLGDMSDARSRKARQQASVEAMRQDRAGKIAKMRQSFRANIQSQLTDGTITFAEAAEAEKMMKAEEYELERQGLQAEFDTLQDVVINPLHEQFNERVQHLTASLESLQRELASSAANQDPDQPVQEGDDVPELLEQLTQLKWLFEARESLHQELFGLLTQRNDAYKAIVALPYHQTNNTDKIRDTEAFFDKDAATRHATFCAEALKRHETFLQFVEDNALRGIELQSSAFWDITPGLVDLMQKIPENLQLLDIQIPEDEMQENPSFTQHPQQYLYHLLRHAEKSSYQYTEGQINLYCLVHEVKTSSLSAHYRASNAQQKMAGDQSIDLADTRLEDEGELTAELKNRAAMIEQQWHDALGSHFETLQERVKNYLEDRGAWEDIEAEIGG